MPIIKFSFISPLDHVHWKEYRTGIDFKHTLFDECFHCVIRTYYFNKCYLYDVHNPHISNDVSDMLSS